MYVQVLILILSLQQCRDVYCKTKKFYSSKTANCCYGKLALYFLDFLTLNY